MSPAMLIFLPVALLLLMAKGAGAQENTTEKDESAPVKVMGFLNEEGTFIPFTSASVEE